MSPTPSTDDFERIARKIFTRIPEPFARHLRHILLRVEEWPDQEILDSFGMDDPHQLTGLYEGVPISEKSQWDMPNPQGDRITLYRQPLLAEWRETGVEFKALIRHVVIHEVGHHFGLSDDDMHALEDAAAE